MFNFANLSSVEVLLSYSISISFAICACGISTKFYVDSFQPTGVSTKLYVDSFQPAGNSTKLYMSASHTVRYHTVAHTVKREIKATENVTQAQKGEVRQLRETISARSPSPSSPDIMK